MRNGLGPVRIRVHGGRLADEMLTRFGVDIESQAFDQPIVDVSGMAVAADAELAPNTVVYTYREAAVEVPVPFESKVLYRDENVLVIDKPHFLATMPRGRHITETALVRLRNALDLPELSPAHRLDRLTAGVLLFTTRREVRAAYHELFARRQVAKTYEALAPTAEGIELPVTIRSRIIKRRSILQAHEVSGPVNAVTRVEMVESMGGLSRYRLTPTTGQTHQLRVHMNALGIPISNDPLYPRVVEVAPDDFTRPLALLARSLAFEDPISGRPVRYDSERQLEPGRGGMRE